MLAVGPMAVMTTGCSKTPKRPPSTVTVPVVVRDVQSILRGTIGSEVTITGIEGMVVSGYGLVVGLDGTGSGIVPIALRSMLETEMRRLGVGTGAPQAGPLARISPSELIDSPDTAVVLVQAYIAAGLPNGATFDVEVTALNGSGVTSLEGGRLYTTDLRRGVASPGGPDTFAVAEASGQIFINPFAFEGRPDSTGAVRTRGRVLDGGRIKQAQPIRLTLDNPSHARAREITRAINNKFQRGTRGDVATGRSDELITIEVPTQWRNEPEMFINMLQFTRIDQTFPEEWARRYAIALIEQPELAPQLSWCLRAIGQPAMPFIRPLYTHPETAPRLAAIEAGAWIGDLTVRRHIEELVESGPIGLRGDALRWLARLPADRDPGVREFLRKHLNNPDIALRVTAYECLRKIDDAGIISRPMGNKFVLDIVRSDKPTIYITQSREPRVVLFGTDLELLPDVFVDAWDGKLLLKADPGNPMAEVFYRRSSRLAPKQLQIDRDVASMVRRLAFEPSPEVFEDGLNMRYSEIVTVLYLLAMKGAVPAVFFPEDDRENIENIRRLASAYTDERPEFAPEDAVPFEPISASGVGEVDEARRRDRTQNPLIVPLPKPEIRRPPVDTGQLPD